MDRVSKFAPVRVFISGVFSLFWGLVFLAVVVFAAWALFLSKDESLKMDPVAKVIISVFLCVPGFIGLASLSDGIGKLIGAFDKRCRLMASEEGVEIALPSAKLYGAYHLRFYRLRWDEIDKIIHHTTTINVIFRSTELRIRLKQGGTITIPRNLFADNTKKLQDRLLHAMSMAPAPPVSV